MANETAKTEAKNDISLSTLSIALESITEAQDCQQNSEQLESLAYANTWLLKFKEDLDNLEKMKSSNLNQAASDKILGDLTKQIKKQHLLIKHPEISSDQILKKYDSKLSILAITFMWCMPIKKQKLQFIYPKEVKILIFY